MWRKTPRWLTVVGTMWLATQLSFVPDHLSLTTDRGLQAISPPQQEDIRELRLGTPIERELAGDQPHIYRIAVSSGQYLRVIVQQQGVDVVVRLLNPGGQQLAWMLTGGRLLR